MKNKLFSGKSTRTKIFTVITAVMLIFLIALNFGLSYFGIYDTAFIDLTPEGIYTLRSVMTDTCDKIFYGEDGRVNEDVNVTITFCADPDKLIENLYTRVVYYMSIALAKRYPNLKVQTVNVTYNPTAVSMYKTTSLTEIKPNDVIISCGQRYRITAAETFWRMNSGTIYSYDGEYKMASLLLSLTLVNRPAAYFVTDEDLRPDYYDVNNTESEMSKSLGHFADLLGECGFEIKNLSLSKIIEDANAAGQTPKIYDDCVLLILNNPKADLSADEDKFGSFSYVSRTELIDRYLTEGKGSVVFTKDYGISLPNLEALLSEWGMSFSNTQVLDSENCIETEDGRQGSSIVGVYNSDEDSYAYSMYGDYVKLTSAPRVIVGNTGHIECSYGDSVTLNESGTHKTYKVFAPFLFTSEKSQEYSKNTSTGEYTDLAGKEKQRTIAAICGRQYLDAITGNYTNSYLFCAASADFFSGELLGNATYANYDVTKAMIQSIARLDTHPSMELGGTSVNSDYLGGKQLVSTTIANDALANHTRIIYAVIIALVPTAIAVAGAVVCIKRKFL